MNYDNFIKFEPYMLSKEDEKKFNMLYHNWNNIPEIDKPTLYEMKIILNTIYLPNISYLAIKKYNKIEKKLNIDNGDIVSTLGDVIEFKIKTKSINNEVFNCIMEHKVDYKNLELYNFLSELLNIPNDTIKYKFMDKINSRIIDKDNDENVSISFDNRKRIKDIFINIYGIKEADTNLNKKQIKIISKYNIFLNFRRFIYNISNYIKSGSFHPKQLILWHIFYRNYNWYLYKLYGADFLAHKRGLITTLEDKRFKKVNDNIINFPTFSKLRKKDFIITTNSSIDELVVVSNITITFKSYNKYDIFILEKLGYIDIIFIIYKYFIQTPEDWKIAIDVGIFRDLEYTDFIKHIPKEIKRFDPISFETLAKINDKYYSYLDSLKRDLFNQMIYSPVMFYLSVIATLFTITSIIQVLQQANIIKPLE